MHLGLEALKILNDLPPQVIVRYHPRKHIALVKQLRDMEENLVSLTEQQIRPLVHTQGESRKMTDEEYITELVPDGKDLWLLTDGITLFGAMLMKTVNEYEHTISLNMLIVSEEHRGQGYGKKLIDYAKTVYKDRYKYIILSTTTKNPAGKLYAREGFTDYMRTMVAKI